MSTPSDGDGDGAPREHLELAHHHPGRLRVRADALINAQETFERIREALDGQPGITAVTYAAQSGSILIQYEPGHADPDDVVAVIADAADLARPLDEDELRRKRADPALVAIGVARELNKLTEELTGHRADLRALGPAAIAGLAAYSFVKEAGQRLPRWDNLLYWSFNIFVMLHKREIDGSSPSDAERAEPAPARA